jgi:hypothetical protein
MFENNSTIMSPVPKQQVRQVPMLTSPTMPINVLEDHIPLNTIQHYGENMLTHLQDTRKIVLDEEQHMREQLHEDVEVERDKLPLTFLFESALRSKGQSEYVAKRALENVTKIIHRLLLAKQATAFNKWIEYDEYLRSELLRRALEERQKEGGAGTVVSIFNRMVQRKISSAIRKWRRVVRMLRKEDQHKAAATIQRSYRYYTGWWNFIKVERNKRKSEQKRVAMSTRLVLFEWLAKKRMRLVIAARRRDILERDSATCIQKAWGRYWAWKSAQDDMKRRRANACVRRMLFRRRNGRMVGLVVVRILVQDFVSVVAVVLGGTPRQYYGVGSVQPQPVPHAAMQQFRPRQATVKGIDKHGPGIRCMLPRPCVAVFPTIPTPPTPPPTKMRKQLVITVQLLLVGLQPQNGFLLFNQSQQARRRNLFQQGFVPLGT